MNFECFFSGKLSNVDFPKYKKFRTFSGNCYMKRAWISCPHKIERAIIDVSLLAVGAMCPGKSSLHKPTSPNGTFLMTRIPPKKKRGTNASMLRIIPRTWMNPLNSKSLDSVYHGCQRKKITSQFFSELFCISAVTKCLEISSYPYFHKTLKCSVFSDSASSPCFLLS